MPRPFLIISVLLFCGKASALAQARITADWKSGLVVLMGGDTVSGSVLLDKDTDLLQVYQGGTVKTYAARQVETFFADGRIFGAFNYPLRGTADIPTFFEIISVGPCLSILARETRLLTRGLGGNEPGPDASFYGVSGRSKKRFFFMDHLGKVREAEKKARNFARQLPSQNKAALAYIKDQKLKPQREADLKKIAIYYNQQLHPCLNQNTP